MTTKRVRKIGDSTLIVYDNMPTIAHFLRVSKMAADRAALAGARQAAKEAKQVLSGGTGAASAARWLPNAPLTRRWKGHARPLIGRTGTLRSSVDIEDGGANRYKVGWFGDKIHPDTDGRLTIAEVAIIQEFGASISVFGNEGEIPPRPHLSQVADNQERADRVTNKMFTVYAERLERFLKGRFDTRSSPIFGQSLDSQFGGRTP